MARVLDLVLIDAFWPALPLWQTAAFVFGDVGIFLGLKLGRARWKAKGYDLSLDPRTGYARHARAIDETRKDFNVLGWGLTKDAQAQHRDKGPWLSQVWFAGNHSDIGGSYPEDESRLSDIALQWMLDELRECVPVEVDESKLKLWASPDGLQHCEVQYSSEAWWRPTWRSTVRTIKNDAPLHPSVLARFTVAEVPLCRRTGPYRPEALREHRDVKHLYPPIAP